MWAANYSKFCTCQREVKIPMFSNIGATLVHFGLAFYLVEYMKWDIYGVSIASCIHFFFRFFILRIGMAVSGRFDKSLQPVFAKESF
jgi:Na+-driven multidrug efflux pump